MDVSNILASQAAKYQSVTVEKEIPLVVDAGFLTVTDLNPIDEESYNENLEEFLQATARDGTQALIASLYSLPSQSSQDGALAQLPPPITELPRSKPLPKPKLMTKWERFAAAKGIQKKVREKRVWDEEKQDWVNRWGKDGKNKEKEQQWITEVPANADVGFSPAAVARDARKARVEKNERQHIQNIARTQASRSDREQRKSEIDRTLATTRGSTASMGKFDKKLEGDKKLHGVKRKFEPTEMPIGKEKQNSLSILSKLDSESKRSKRDHGGGDEVVNVRKAIRATSKGQGGVALGRAQKKSGRTDKRSRKR